MKIFTWLVLSLMLTIGACRTTSIVSGIGKIRESIETLPEPTFNTVAVITHDYAALGIRTLLAKEPSARVPLRTLAESALSTLENQQALMLDIVSLSASLDEIQDGKVKKYLDIAWTLLEINGVIRRDDVNAVLTNREQKLLLALFKGIKLGTGDATDVQRKLDAQGSRW